jgi:hypothetical protein
MLQTAAIKDYVSESFRKTANSETSSDKFIVPDWHKKIVLDRINNPKTPVDAFEMIEELEFQDVAKV